MGDFYGTGIEIWAGFGPTVPIAEILGGKNARAWVSMVLYLKK